MSAAGTVIFSHRINPGQLYVVATKARNLFGYPCPKQLRLDSHDLIDIVPSNQMKVMRADDMLPL